jgi:hypothetical protein
MCEERGHGLSLLMREPTRERKGVWTNDTHILLAEVRIISLPIPHREYRFPYTQK